MIECQTYVTPSLLWSVFAVIVSINLMTTGYYFATSHKLKKLQQLQRKPNKPIIITTTRYR